MHVTLMGTVDSEDDIVQLMTTLAESLRPHWYYACTFVNLSCTMPLSQRSVPLSDSRGECKYRVTGFLGPTLPENAAEGEDDWGFTVKVKSFLDFSNGTTQRTDFRYGRAYPPLYMCRRGSRPAVVPLRCT
jgi:hypothetical protein